MEKDKDDSEEGKLLINLALKNMPKIFQNIESENV